MLSRRFFLTACTALLGPCFGSCTSSRPTSGRSLFWWKVCKSVGVSSGGLIEPEDKRLCLRFADCRLAALPIDSELNLVATGRTWLTLYASRAMSPNGYIIRIEGEYGGENNAEIVVTAGYLERQFEFELNGQHARRSSFIEHTPPIPDGRIARLPPKHKTDLPEDLRQFDSVLTLTLEIRRPTSDAIAWLRIDRVCVDPLFHV